MFAPDYRNLLNAARNVESARLPLYEHIIGDGIIEKILNVQISGLLSGSYRDKLEYMTHYCEFFRKMGYDTVSFEMCAGPVYPGSGLLGGHGIPPAIEDRADYERYPWDEIPDDYFRAYSDIFAALREAMPEGMKAVGGVGNGIFECVQDIIGFENLCYLRSDDEELYSDLFEKVGQTNLKIWKRFMKEFGDIYCVCRFGDDLGYKSNTMLPADDIRTHIIPQYKKIIDLIHSYNKPFLLHSCGQIFNVMDDIIEAGIDAKHSNEDQIATFDVWVKKYGDKIGNFGGIDTDAVCRLTKPEMQDYITEMVSKCKGHGGFAFGSGNSIPDYVPVEGYLNMNEIVRELREE